MEQQARQILDQVSRTEWTVLGEVPKPRRLIEGWTVKTVLMKLQKKYELVYRWGLHFVHAIKNLHEAGLKSDRLT